MRLAALTFVACAVCSALAGDAKKFERPFVPPKRWALCIGAGNYAFLGKLKFAAADADLMAKTLEERFAFSPESVTTITDSNYSQLKPTAHDIEATLDEKLKDKRLDKGDLFILYFSGHGIGTASGDYLAPTDATQENIEKVGIPVKSLTDRFVAAGLKNVVIITDACRAGEKNEFGEELWDLGRKTNLAVLLGCSPGERSYEYPSLGHGVFTYQLTKALRNKELCHPVSGALWMSRIAEKVSADVFSYTQRDYGDHAQKPRAWAEKTADVFLGAFPSKVDAKVVVEAIKGESKELDSAKLSETLELLGTSMWGQDDALAIEAFKTCHGMGTLSPGSLYCLGFLLEGAGRTNEASHIFDELAHQTDSSLYKDLAVLFSVSREISPQERLKAADRAWALEPDQFVGNLAMQCSILYGSSADRIKTINRVLSLPSLDERFRSYTLGLKALTEEKHAIAQQDFEKALTLPGEDPQSSVLVGYVGACLEYTGNQKSLLEFYARAYQIDPTNAAKWHLTAAEHYQAGGMKAEYLREVALALDRKPDGDQMLQALRIVVLDYPQFKEQVERRAAEIPLSWKAQLAKAFVEGAADGSHAQAFQDALHLSDDDYAALFEMYRVLDLQLEKVVEQGGMDPQQYATFLLNFSQVMAENVDKFGYDYYSWLLFDKFCLLTERFEQLHRIYEIKLGEQADKGTLLPELRQPFFYAALAMGDSHRVWQMLDLATQAHGDTSDFIVSLAISATINGDTKTAKSLLARGYKGTIFPKQVHAVELVIKAAEGTKVDLRSEAAKLDDAVAKEIFAIAMATRGDWKNAEPIMSELLFTRVATSLNVQARMVSLYFQRLIATKRYSEAEEVAHKVQISSYGNPLYSTIHFGKKPGVAGFAGKIEANASQFVLPTMPNPGTFSMQISSSGLVKGLTTIGDQPEPFQGTVDEYGNLKANVQANGQMYQITGKIAQPSYYKTRKKGIFGCFLLLDRKGQCLYWVIEQ